MIDKSNIKTDRIVVRLTEKQSLWLKNLSEDTKIAKAKIIRNIINFYMEKCEH